MKEKYCIKSIAPFHTINQSPTNLSSSKQTFSFSKSSRFEPIKATYFFLDADAQQVHMEELRSPVRDQELVLELARNQISQRKFLIILREEDILFLVYSTPTKSKRKVCRLAAVETPSYAMPMSTR